MTSPSDCSTSRGPPISFGVPIQPSAIGSGPEIHIYRFNANGGDRLYFDAPIDGGNQTAWRLIDPFGRALWSNYYSDHPAEPL